MYVISVFKFFNVIFIGMMGDGWVLLNGLVMFLMIVKVGCGCSMKKVLNCFC